MARRDIAIFDLGGVLLDWNPRHLYRKLLRGDEAAMERFLATVCTNEWNRGQDSGRSFAEGCRLLKARHPDKADLIDAYHARFDEMIAGPIEGTVAILAELRERDTPLYFLAATIPLRPTRSRLIGSNFSRGSPAASSQAMSAHSSQTRKSMRC